LKIRYGHGDERVFGGFCGELEFVGFGDGWEWVDGDRWFLLFGQVFFLIPRHGGLNILIILVRFESKTKLNKR
jgi:hypothetical protein